MPSMPAWLRLPAPAPSKAQAQAARQRQSLLTKPEQSLGRLETLAITLAAQQHSERPQICAPQITLFAADHGIAKRGVSAFPQAVTAQMIANFYRGGSALSVLARSHGVDLEVVNLGTVTAPPVPSAASDVSLIDQTIGPGTADFSQQAAMSQAQCCQALDAGRSAIERCQTGCNLFIGGEMGIGNTSSSSALAACLLQIDPDPLCGCGTGLDERGRQHKLQLIKQALARFAADRKEPTSSHQQLAFDALYQLGGFEIAALTGAYISAAQRGISILLDGVISTAAALIAQRINPSIGPWLLASHCSAEPAHQHLLAALGLEPLLQWQMRLGEASGAALCLPLLRSACAIHNEMATFAEAQVSQ
ncbi:MAG: nicotinate-nucleotide--dimethylbenzimidazole phosphoribosyltransferase [Cellvibrionaceae bacterium]|nr:nicotinate-nucleotide--dimethylbenzimidazole phosphoribosyltransferase [Cellvibrionaceae bacterium]